MLLQILLLLLGLQVVDLLLLIVLGRSIGFLQTLALLLVMGLVGGALARREGGRVLRSFQAALAEGRAPEHGVIDGMLALLGGVLLLLPGILSDVFALALLFPPLRRLLARALRRRLEGGLALREVPLPFAPPFTGDQGLGGAERRPGGGEPTVIETTGVESPDEAGALGAGRKH